MSEADTEDETDDDAGNIQVVFSPEVQARLDADPRLKDAMRFFTETLHQAAHAVKSGQYQTMDEALEALLGTRPVKRDTLTGEIIEGASMHDEMFGISDDDDDC